VHQLPFRCTILPMARPSWYENLSPPNRAALVWGVISILLVFVIGRGAVANLRLAIDGSKSMATVTDHDVGNHDACEFTFFTSSGALYSGSNSACAADHPIGSTLPVTYLPSDPTISSVSSPVNDAAQGIAIFVFAPAGASLLVLFGSKKSQKRRQTQSAPTKI
jgi:hypothetical protein